ncbi:LysR family transcriptional regulator [Litorilituus lipolyticus]|uniref:LysR family transcriptional regulator n=1 Tax=Litorilituus lipolyticus TaxID=2491017 RepID=A0A502KZX5_9GAMM|nr:LysR family transcriptional regulator [Litorilituus lipolyticus]TPH15243.1 LysR family transcriptional regulator [Litorilituus lipolyticus]
MELSEQKLSRIDLNLLISLSVLLKERNVSRAAERLYLSQSAMSRTLQRLRALFDDPLFNRTAQGIIPTSKALEIEQLLPDLLQSLSMILDNAPFNAASCDKHIAISMPVLISQAFFESFFIELTRQAPNITLAEYSAKANPFPLLASGALDFAIHSETLNDNHFNSIRLGTITPAIFARIDHPLAKKKSLRLNDCLYYKFIELNIEDEHSHNFINPVNHILSKQGMKRDIQVKSSQFSIVMELLNRTDSLLIGPNFLLQNKLIAQDCCNIFTFDESHDNSLELFLISHQRIENSDAHQWVQQQILDSFSIN